MGLREYATDKAFQAKWRAVKQIRKAKLAAFMKKSTGDDVNLNSLFDIHVRPGKGGPNTVWARLCAI